MKPVIAMTREMGSLGKDVAAGLAERTGRRVVYHQIIEPVANKMRLRKSHVERFLEGKSGLWERLTTDQTSLNIYTAEETFRLLADESTGVVRGWGAVHLLKDIPHVVRVRVCAPLETRLRRMMERLGTDNREAVQREIELSEEAHTAITRRHFGLNWRDSEHYDVVLSTEHLSVEDCIEEIERVCAKPRFQPTADSVRLLEDLALEWRVRSALHTQVNTGGREIGVRAAAGTVWLTGGLNNRAEGLLAGEVAAKVQGVKKVENELGAAGSASLRQWQEA